MSASRPASALSALSSSSVEDMPRTRARTAPKKATTPTARMTTRKRTTTATTTRKSVARTTKAKAGSSKKAAASRPPWKDIIRECIADNKDDARVGVSRAVIKKFAEERYGVEINPANIFQLGRAIASGTETGIFVLPKGASGKVKLASKTGKPSAAKENSTVTTTKKSAVPKKVLAGAKAPNKKPSSASQRNGAKKAVTGRTAAKGRR